MVKFCRACQSGIVDDAALCPSCGLQQLIFPEAITKLRRVWHFAGLLVGVLSVVSISLAVGVARHDISQSGRNPRRLAVPSDRNIVYRRSVVLVEETRKVYPYSIVAGGAPNVDEAKLAMHRPEVRANYANVDFAKLHEVKLATNLSGYVSYRYRREDLLDCEKAYAPCRGDWCSRTACTLSAGAASIAIPPFRCCQSARMSHPKTC